MSIARSVVGQYLEERPVAEGAITPELSPPPRTYNTPDTLHILSMNRFHSHCIQTSIRQGTAMRINLGQTNLRNPGCWARNRCISDSVVEIMRDGTFERSSRLINGGSLAEF